MTDKFLALRFFLNNKKPLININELSKLSGVNQRLRRYLLLRPEDLSDLDGNSVNRQLVKLYESLGKYLIDNKIIEPKGLFK